MTDWSIKNGIEPRYERRVTFDHTKAGLPQESVDAIIKAGEVIHSRGLDIEFIWPRNTRWGRFKDRLWCMKYDFMDMVDELLYRLRR